MPTNVSGPFEKAHNYLIKKALLVYAVFIENSIQYIYCRKEL